ncbi:MAG TPA: hypothetical protein VGG94_06120 [Chthoniobacterales bacterium]
MTAATSLTHRGALFLALLSLPLLLATGCKKSETQSAQAPSQESSAAQRDVCGLIKADEMETVIASPVKETKASGQSNEGIRVSQCYFAAGDSSRSVSLSVTDRDHASATGRGGNQYWEGMFGRYDKEQAEKETDAEKAKKESLREQERGAREEEEGSPPRKISGIGDEAFWSGNRVGGALYVLDKKHDAFIRVSVGGADTEEKKIEKSRALALRALSRL